MISRELLAEDGEAPPEPRSKRTYSGRFLLRMPPQLHRALSLEASAQGASLNQLIVSRLTPAPTSDDVVVTHGRDGRVRARPAGKKAAKKAQVSGRDR